MPAQVLHEVAGNVHLNPGAGRLVRALRHFGYRMAIISGGFQDVGNRLRERLGIDHVFANELCIEDGVVTGEVRGEIIDAAAKAALLRRLARDEGILLAQTIAIGDGANDLPHAQRRRAGGWPTTPSSWCDAPPATQSPTSAWTRCST